MAATTEVEDIILGKEQVINDEPKVIKELQFGVLYGSPAKAQRKILMSTDRTKT